MAFQRITFAKVGWSIDFLDCEDVVDGVARICHGWNIKVRTDPLAGPDPRARISFRGGKWHWRRLGAPKPRDWDRLPPKSAMRVITDVQDAALHWYLDDNRRCIGLHAAAVQLGDSLACFPARGFTGKSTLVACLARRGHRAFGDDVIMVAGGRAAASFGFSPRLRTPLPSNLSAATARFIAARADPASHGWAYVALAGNESASLGEKREIGSIVLLQRQPEGGARLEPAEKLDALKLLLAEHLPGRQPLPQVFDRMKNLASSADCYRLSFSRADDAARLLERRLA